MSGAVVGDDGLARCPWAAAGELNRDYHDTEWGMPVHGEAAYFERLTLEGFQSGLSWRTILEKRENFRQAFAGFDADQVASYGAADRERLMADAGIVRNQRKVEAAITNARATVALRDRGGLEDFILGFRPDPVPAPLTSFDLPTTTPASVALAESLKRAGFVFVGPTTMHALMEAVGLVDDHLAGCHRRGAAGESSRR